MPCNGSHNETNGQHGHQQRPADDDPAATRLKGHPASDQPLVLARVLGHTFRNSS